ncbi:MAG: hypothetical protein AB7H77_06260 [Bdellovibrionales bacterium]
MTSTTETQIAPPMLPFIGQGQSLMKAALLMALASATLLPHFLLCAVFGPVGFVGVVGVTLAGMFLNTQFAFALFVICLFLQNLFIAIVTPLTPGVDNFTPMLGTSFVNIVLTSGLCAIVWQKERLALPAASASLQRSLLFFFIVVVLYGGLGVMHASLNDAILYMRVYLVGGLLLIMGVAFGLYLTSGFSMNVLKVMTFLLVLWGLLEFLFTYGMYSLFNIAEYLRLKYSTDLYSTFYSIEETINFASRSYLNLSGALGLQVDLLRPQGPNVHPISYAYALAFGAIVAYVNRATLLTAGCLALLLLVGAKGPLIMGFLSLMLATFYGFARNPHWLKTSLVASMALYIVAGLAYGSYTRDYHVIGFWGGVTGFISNPLGHGVGVGGNLSSLAGAKTNFSFFQNYGANFALESGFGVMLYQIGICTIVFLFFYWRLWQNVWRAVMHFSNEPRLVAIPCALAILLVNSIFQEEAFSPAGWGPLMLLSGLLLAKYWKALMLPSSRQSDA